MKNNLVSLNIILSLLFLIMSTLFLICIFRNKEHFGNEYYTWKYGQEIYRVTGRKDQWGEVEEFICNTCRFDKKAPSDWTEEGPRKLSRHSVISQGHYGAKTKFVASPVTLPNKQLS
jgi:hypothetical protein